MQLATVLVYLIAAFEAAAQTACSSLSPGQFTLGPAIGYEEQESSRVPLTDFI